VNTDINLNRSAFRLSDGTHLRLPRVPNNATHCRALMPCAVEALLEQLWQ